MARFRTYKNGLFAHRYKGYYVTRQDASDEKKRTYSVVNADKEIIEENFSDYWDAEWAIDKMTASPELTIILKQLYGEEIFMLSKFFLELMEKDNSNGLDPDEQELYEWVRKIRARKADGKPY